jgi:nicotinate-nucleotide adenylyltransferase
MDRGAEGATSERIGVFGGTFDPPHIGHVRVAVEVTDQLGLDRLLWIPAGRPPHKTSSDVTDPRIRLEMVRLTASTDPRFEVSSIELDRPGPSYTVDTLRTLRKLHPTAEIFLILGADEVRDLPTTWRQPESVLGLARLAIMDREGESALDAAPALPGMERAVHVPVPRVDVSSTAVREAVRSGEEYQALLPPGVAAVVRREGLYRAM